MKSHSLIILAFFFLSCNSQSPKTIISSFELGTLQGNTFSNKYFGFELKIDTLWYILNKAELNHLINHKVDMLNESADKNLSISKGADILLSLTIDTIETMPHVLLSSLDLNMFPQIKNEKDYLDDYFKQVKKMYENYDVQITSSEIIQETINGKSFFTTLIIIKADSFLAYQKRYSIKIKDRLLNLMANYNSEVYAKESANLLNKIKWE